jgi:SAM-dependent methyltransferase
MGTSITAACSTRVIYDPDGEDLKTPTEAEAGSEILQIRQERMSEARDSRSSRRASGSERLSKLGWYHSIELPDGSVIEGHQTVEQLRTRIGQFPIPEDLTGKRVLDIGAWDGWFSFEMERRGAQVLAVDSTKNTRLLEAKALLGSRIDYHIGDICRLTSKDIGHLRYRAVPRRPLPPEAPASGARKRLRDVPRHGLHRVVCHRCRIPTPFRSMEFYETTELRGTAG